MLANVNCTGEPCGICWLHTLYRGVDRLRLYALMLFLFETLSVLFRVSCRDFDLYLRFVCPGFGSIVMHFVCLENSSSGASDELKNSSIVARSDVWIWQLSSSMLWTCSNTMRVVFFGCETAALEFCDTLIILSCSCSSWVPSMNEIWFSSVLCLSDSFVFLSAVSIESNFTSMYWVPVCVAAILLMTCPSLCSCFLFASSFFFPFRPVEFC